MTETRLSSWLRPTSFSSHDAAVPDTTISRSTDLNRNVTQTHIVDPEEAECHHVGTPLGPGATGAAAGSDAAAVKHDRHIVGPFGLTGLTGHHCSTEVEA